MTEAHWSGLPVSSSVSANECQTLAYYLCLQVRGLQGGYKDGLQPETLADGNHLCLLVNDQYAVVIGKPW